jgi:ubiquinone/menaquinone biosynthesis C-methylase UbiE
MFTIEEVRGIYRKRAARYDWSANLYYLIGFREQAYRRRAVALLDAAPGDAIVEIGCGTGLNFPLLERAVGPNGRIVGVDLTDAMLAQARRRVARHGWTNVDLIQAEAARFDFPPNLGGVISTFAITLVPEYDEVIRRAVSALAPGRRIVILDFKLPERAPDWLVDLGVWIMRPFAVTRDLAVRHPWESVQRYAFRPSMSECYWGFAYIAAGEAPQSAPAVEDRGGAG